MLTIELPVSKAREGEEDAFAKAILEELKEDGSAYIYLHGAGYIQKSLRWSIGSSTAVKTPISDDAFYNVIRAFREKGYSISNGSRCPGYEITIIRG